MKRFIFIFFLSCFFSLVVQKHMIIEASDPEIPKDKVKVVIVTEKQMVALRAVQG